MYSTYIVIRHMAISIISRLRLRLTLHMGHNRRNGFEALKLKSFDRLERHAALKELGEADLYQGSTAVDFCL